MQQHKLISTDLFINIQRKIAPPSLSRFLRAVIIVLRQIKYCSIKIYISYFYSYQTYH